MDNCSSSKPLVELTSSTRIEIEAISIRNSSLQKILSIRRGILNWIGGFVMNSCVCKFACVKCSQIGLSWIDFIGIDSSDTFIDAFQSALSIESLSFKNLRVNSTPIILKADNESDVTVTNSTVSHFSNGGLLFDVGNAFSSENNAFKGLFYQKSGGIVAQISTEVTVIPNSRFKLGWMICLGVLALGLVCFIQRMSFSGKSRRPTPYMWDDAYFFLMAENEDVDDERSES